MAFRFQNWQVYKDSREFRIKLGSILKTLPADEKYVLVNQCKRAMLSVILQLAEGSNRKTEKDKHLFLSRAASSLDEVIACLDCTLDSKYISKSVFEDLMKDIENLSRQLRGFEQHISNSY